MAKEENKNQGIIERSWPFILFFVLFTSLSIVFGILCIDGIEIGFFQHYKGIVIALAIAILCGVCVFSLWLVFKEKVTLVKTLISGYVLLLFCLILVFVLLQTGFFEVIGSAESLQEYLEKSGAWMPIVYIVLQYLQVVLLPIPSVVSTVAGLTLFGPFNTMIYSMIGIYAGSMTGFFVGRKLGYKAVSWVIGEDTLKKWQEKLKGKDNLVLTSMFVLPVFPDDVLCFVAGLSSMSTRYFLIMIFIARILGIGATCYFFEYIPFNTWWGLLFWGIFFAIMGTIVFLIYKNMDKLQSWIDQRKAKKGDKK